MSWRRAMPAASRRRWISGQGYGASASLEELDSDCRDPRGGPRLPALPVPACLPRASFSLHGEGWGAAGKGGVELVVPPKIPSVGLSPGGSAPSPTLGPPQGDPQHPTGG